MSGRRGGSVNWAARTPRRSSERQNAALHLLILCVAASTTMLIIHRNRELTTGVTGRSSRRFACLELTR